MPTKKTKPKRKEMDILRRISQYSVLDVRTREGDVDVYLNRENVYSTCIWEEKYRREALKELEALIDALIRVKDYIENYDYSDKKLELMSQI